MVSEISKEDINDVNALGKLLNSNFEKLFHISNLNPGEKIYVYKENNVLLGFIHISINYEVVDLLNICVNSDYRHKKIGSILMDYMITDLPVTSERILLEVNEDNESAIKFYTKFNFMIINERNNYYGTNKALIMERVLR